MSAPGRSQALVPQPRSAEGSPLSPNEADFGDVQRIVRYGRHWSVARHLMVEIGDGCPLRFLQRLLCRRWPSPSSEPPSDLQVSVGFTRRGLERSQVPQTALTRFALKAPAFWAGAARRASSRLGMCDDNAPEHWHDSFAYNRLDMVVSLHALDAQVLEKRVGVVRKLIAESGLHHHELPLAEALPGPVSKASPNAKPMPGQWVHFGFRDGVSRVAVKGWTSNHPPEAGQSIWQPIRQHSAGEFVLGHPQDSGANPWVSGPGLQVWPAKLLPFFRNGSFGILQQIHQEVAEFETFVNAAAEASGLSVEVIKGKLCGRFSDGLSLAAATDTDPRADFDYSADPKGHKCPFGSHVRRMNPRLPDDATIRAGFDELPVHAERSRILLRRGMPYGPAWSTGEAEAGRGLMGHFFCASIEEQFEHLLAEWAERVPIGFADRHGARDPLIGAHEPTDGAFEIPQPEAGNAPVRLLGLKPFTRTLGAAYLFYPSLTALQQIANSSFWGADDTDDDAR